MTHAGVKRRLHRLGVETFNVSGFGIANIIEVGTDVVFASQGNYTVATVCGRNASLARAFSYCKGVKTLETVELGFELC